MLFVEEGNAAISSFVVVIVDTVVVAIFVLFLADEDKALFILFWKRLVFFFDYLPFLISKEALEVERQKKHEYLCSPPLKCSSSF